MHFAPRTAVCSARASPRRPPPEQHTAQSAGRRVRRGSPGAATTVVGPDWLARQERDQLGHAYPLSPLAKGDADEDRKAAGAVELSPTGLIQRQAYFSSPVGIPEPLHVNLARDEPTRPRPFNLRVGRRLAERLACVPCLG